MDSTMETADLSTQSCPILPMFNSSTGKLHQLLGKGEYVLLKDIPIFESDFIQTNRRGEVVDVHNAVHVVTVGVACTSLQLSMPDVLLLAQPAASCALRASDDPDALTADLTATECLELTRLLPLKFVKLSIYNREKKQFQLKLATGRSFYLQLCLPSNAKEDVFAFWEDLVGLLRPPVEAYSGIQAQPAGDMISIPGLEVDDRKSLSAMELHGQGDQDQAMGSSLSVLTILSDVSEAASLAYTGGEGSGQQASYCLRRNTPSILLPVPVGPDAGAAPRAVGPLQGGVNVAAGGQTVSRPVAGATDGADTGASVCAGPTEGNTSPPDGGQRPPPGPAEAPGKRKERERTAADRLYHLSRMWEATSFLKAHGAPWGDKGEPPSSLRERGCGALLHEYISLSLSQKGSRFSQKLRRSLSRTRSGRVP